LMAVWYDVLYHSSAAGIQSAHFFRSWNVMHRRYCSRHWFTRSVWPSVSYTSRRCWERRISQTIDC
jgi:cation diffusion facilitator CzcD-associated flavoprotein CzcO